MKTLKTMKRYLPLLIFLFTLLSCDNPLLMEVLEPLFPEECRYCLLSYDIPLSCEYESFETRKCPKHRVHDKYTRYVYGPHTWGITPVAAVNGLQVRKCTECDTYSDNTFYVANTNDWNEVTKLIQDGKVDSSYTINIIGDFSVVNPPNNTFGNGFRGSVTITGNKTMSLSSTGSLLSIADGQTVTIKDVTLRGVNTNTSPLVQVNSGSLTMNSGTITGNTTTTSGAGVSVTNGGTFTMSGSALITGNTAYGSSLGGGVFVRGATFTMSGGTISYNTVAGANEGGGVNVDSGGRFTMSGSALITNNTAGVGGGVFVYGPCRFTMSGGSISGNNAANGGGVGVNIGGTFTMNGGSVRNNTATVNGAGVYNIGTFTMNGGTISGNAPDQVYP